MAYTVAYTYKVIDRYSKPLNAMRTATGKFRTATVGAANMNKKMAKQADGLGSSLTALAAIIGGANIIGKYTKYEAAVNRARGSTKATDEEFRQLRDTAIKMGQTTTFNAIQSAEALDMLGRNGLKVAQILGGAGQASLTLAAARSADLAIVADIATDAMGGFKLKAEDMAWVVDRIAGVTVNSKFTLEDYAYAINNAGTTARIAGVSFDEFNAMIAATAFSFASGRDAGGAFKSFLLKLARPTKRATNAMKKIGLWTKETGSAFYDSSKNLKSMADIIELLNKATRDLSEQERPAILKDIAGMYGVRAAMAMADMTKEHFNNVRAQIESISATKMASQQLEGLTGAVILLGSALSTVNITMMEYGGVAKTLEVVSRSLTGMINAFAALPPWLLGIIGHTGMLLAVFAALGGAVILLNSALTVLSINPIVGAFMAIYLAVMAVVTAITLLIQNWEKVKSWIFVGPIGPKVAAQAAAAQAATVNGQIDINAPPGVVKGAAMDTTSTVNLGFNLM